jgi:hypothetical protein
VIQQDPSKHDHLGGDIGLKPKTRPGHLPSSRPSSKDDHMYFFVPEKDIDIVALAAYLKRYVDATCTIKPSKHPRDRDKLGYTVGAGSTLSREGLSDVINDSLNWADERSSSAYKRDPYDYNESDTWQDRLDDGPTEARKTITVTRRERRRGDIVDERRTDPHTNSRSIASHPADQSSSEEDSDFPTRRSDFKRTSKPKSSIEPRPRYSIAELDEASLSRHDTTVDKVRRNRPSDGSIVSNDSGYQSLTSRDGKSKHGRNVYDPWH